MKFLLLPLEINPIDVIRFEKLKGSFCKTVLFETKQHYMRGACPSEDIKKKLDNERMKVFKSVRKFGRFKQKGLFERF